MEDGFFATLTPEQQRAALEYRGEDWHGSPQGELRMVAIFRTDIALPVGKLAVQAGHAFLTAWRIFYSRSPSEADRYVETSQTKLVMVAPDLAALQKIRDRAERRGVVAALITDAARTVFSEPTPTVLCLGPMSKTDSNALTRGLLLMGAPDTEETQR